MQSHEYTLRELDERKTQLVETHNTVRNESLPLADLTIFLFSDFEHGKGSRRCQGEAKLQREDD